VLCKSAPFCREEAADGRRFCAAHQEILDRVKAAPRSKASPANGKPAAVVVRRERPGLLREQFSAAILQALAAGPMNGSELAVAVGTKPIARTYARAREGLLREGKIVRSAGDAHAKKYSLASTAQSDAD
jgi:hypothetical protein